MIKGEWTQAIGKIVVIWSDVVAAWKDCVTGSKAFKKIIDFFMHFTLWGFLFDCGKNIIFHFGNLWKDITGMIGEIKDGDWTGAGYNLGDFFYLLLFK